MTTGMSSVESPEMALVFRKGPNKLLIAFGG